jgi:hypothetical protein
LDRDESVDWKTTNRRPRGEFVPGETIIKLYYSKLIDGYVTVPGDSMFKVASDGYTLEAVG